MDRIIEVKVAGSHLTKDNRNAGVQHEANSKRLRITFDEGWDGYAKTVTWWDALGQNPVKRVLTTDCLEDATKDTRVYLCPIPGEAMTEDGMCTFIIDGYSDGKRMRSVSDELLVSDAPFDENADEPADPTPSQAEQLQEQIDTIMDDIQNVTLGSVASEEAANSARAAAASADAAKKSETAANSSKTAAATSATNAAADRKAIEDMTVEAVTLEPGSEATAEKSKKNGVYNIKYGIPRGASGVYVGSGDMPDGYNVQVDPDGDITGVEELVDIIIPRNVWPDLSYAERDGKEVANGGLGYEPLVGTSATAGYCVTGYIPIRSGETLRSYGLDYNAGVDGTNYVVGGINMGWFDLMGMFFSDGKGEWGSGFISRGTLKTDYGLIVDESGDIVLKIDPSRPGFQDKADKIEFVKIRLLTSAQDFDNLEIFISGHKWFNPEYKIPACEALDKRVEALEQGGGGSGSPGEAGENGATFTPSVDASGNLSWSNDKGLPNPPTVNIKGATGATGNTGNTGPTGPAGPTGSPGRTPVKGTDYWTATDKQSIVNDVLAALPAAEGSGF